MDFHDIYENRPDKYHALVEAEDADGLILASLEGLLPLDGLDVVEVGLGTGRITCQLQAAGASVCGVEPAEPMLTVARKRFEAVGGDPAQLVSGQFEAIPFPANSADLAVAGWVLGHQRAWFPDDFRSRVRAGLEEMYRVTRPGGFVAIFETLGTGHETPATLPELEELYAVFEEDFGFQRQVLRTDYEFESVEEAAEKMGFFFGDELVARIQRHQWARVPECTGFWSCRVI